MKESTKLIIAISVGLFGMILLIIGLYDKKVVIPDDVPTIEVSNEVETTTTSTITTTTTKTSKKAVKTTKKAIKVKTASKEEYIAYTKLYSNYDEEQMKCLITLWNNESNWNPNDVNPTSGACGIPQANPCNKIKNQQGSNDWKAQIRWGVNYINYKYKTPCKALRISLSRNPHWY